MFISEKSNYTEFTWQKHHLVLCILTCENFLLIHSHVLKWQKSLENNFLLLHCGMRGSHLHAEKWFKLESNLPGATSFGRQSAFGSRSLTQKISFFFLSLNEPCVSVSNTWWKSTLFMIFKCFISFATMQTQILTSMHSLVKIHTN